MLLYGDFPVIIDDRSLSFLREAWEEECAFRVVLLLQNNQERHSKWTLCLATCDEPVQRSLALQFVCVSLDYPILDCIVLVNGNLTKINIR